MVSQKCKTAMSRVCRAFETALNGMDCNIFQVSGVSAEAPIAPQSSRQAEGKHGCWTSLACRILAPKFIASSARGWLQAL